MTADNLVPINKVAAKLGVTVAVVRMWVRKGAIPKGGYVKVGNTYRFDLPYIMATLLRPEQQEEERPSPEWRSAQARAIQVEEEPEEEDPVVELDADTEEDDTDQDL